MRENSVIGQRVRQHSDEGSFFSPTVRLQRALAWPLLYKVLFANSVVILLGATMGTYLATRLRSSNGVMALVVFVVVGLLVSVIINYALLKFALYPLTRLRETMRLAQAGDLTHKAPITGQDPDADQLASTFNTMLEAIDELSKSRASHILHAQEQERKRIARELHDETSQALTSLLISLALVEEAVSEASAHERIGEARALAHQTLRAVRNLSIDLRPSALDDLGLLPALRWYVKEYQQKCGIAVELVATGLRERLPTEVETAVYRIVQESLTNTARHGHAQRVWVTVMEEPERLQVIVRDDGVGFDAQATLKKPWQDRGLGLAGMQERAMLVNGALAVKSRQGEGVTIEVTIPIPARPALRQAVQLA